MMRTTRQLAVAWWFMASAAGAQSATVPPTPTTTRATTPVAAAEIAPASRFPYAPGVDVQHYDIALMLDGQGHAVQGNATLTLQRARTVDTLRLDLLALTVDRVLVNGRVREVRRDSARLHIPLRASDGIRLRIGIRYHGEPSDGLIVRADTARGWSAFGDNWPDRARYWIPSIDHPSDKATITWSVTAPSRLTVVANGQRLSRRLAAARAGEERMATTRYQLTQPIPTYLMVVGVASLREYTLGRTACGRAADGGCVPQSVWTFPPEAPTMPGNFREAGRIVTTFADWLGAFPYPRLSHVQSATRFGGMENASAIFYSDQAFRSGTVNTSLIAHETAHQWFGDAVTPRRWADLWLSEGFATFLAAAYTQRTRGDSAYLDEMRRIRAEILAAPVAATRPVVDSVGAETPLTLLNANSYQKGGFVLHMLRARIGDVAFFGALRDYQRTHRHGTAITDDFRRAAERRSGTALADFFGQWLHRPGWAALTITWNWRPETGTLALQIMQGTTFPPFAVPLTLRVLQTDGTTRDVRVDVAAQASQSLLVPLAGVREIASLTADPRVELLGRVELLQAMP
jgi:aminopeptidase N